MKQIVLVCVLLLAFVGCVNNRTSTEMPGSSRASHSYKTEHGYVPDKATAISIAVSVWNVVYGADQIAKQKPYVAEIKGNVWMVRGTLPENLLGGLAETTEQDCSESKVAHSRGSGLLPRTCGSCPTLIQNKT